MAQHFQPNTQWKRLGQYVLLIPILLLATYLRTVEIGLEGLALDDSVHMLLALPITEGQPVFRGVPSSVGLWHPPFPLYVFSVPLFFSLDPRLSRLWIAVLNLFAVCVAYVIGRRYFSLRAGLIASLLYAFHPIALAAARSVWVPNVPPVFVFLYTLSGLMGYTEAQDHPRARLLHLPMLSLAAQCHEIVALLAPISGVLLLYGWLSFPERRGRLARDTMISGLVAAALWIPWAIGMWTYFQETGSGVGETYSFLHNRGLRYLYETLVAGLGGWPNHPTKPIQPLLTLVGGMWLIGRAARSRKGLPGLVIVLAYLLIPVLAFVLDLPYREYHHRPSYAHAFLIQGAAVDAFLRLLARAPERVHDVRWRRRLAFAPRLGWLLIIPLAALMAAQLQQAYFDRRIVYNVPLRDVMAATSEAVERVRQSGGALVILTPTQNDGAEPHWSWELIKLWARREGIDSRTAWYGWGIPITEDGSHVLIPDTFPTGEASLLAAGEQVRPRMRLVALDADLNRLPILGPLEPARFSNGVSVIGFFRESEEDPQPGEPWVVWMIWRIDAPAAGPYTAFLHLVDGQGNRIAQADQPTRPPVEWQPGEMVINRFELMADAGVPEEGPLYLRYGMYDESGTPAERIDEAGQNIGRAFELFQVRAAGLAGGGLTDDLQLDAFQTNSPLALGQPLEVRVTWHTDAPPDQDYRARWRLIDSAGETVYEEIGELASAHPTSGWPGGLFVPGFAFLRVPNDLPAGAYSAELQLIDEAEQPVGEAYTENVTIMADRERRFAAPDFAESVGAAFSDAISLLGYDLDQDGDSLRLTLHWQAGERVEGNYHYFVHVLQGDQVVAQADGIPGDGRIPTYWWAAGEVISQTITLDVSALPPGAYTVRTGFYDPVTLERLRITLPDGSAPEDRSVRLGEVTID